MKFDILLDKRTVVDNDDPLADLAQTERIGLGDLIIAAIIAVAVWTLQAIWSLPIVHPSNWADIAAASGVRPASHLVGGYFVTGASLIYRTFGISAGDVILEWLGRLALVGIAIVMYGALREMLAFIMRARPQRSNRRSLVMQIASIVGTFAFIASDPVWRAGQFLSETTIQLSLMLFSLEFFFVFLRKGSLRYAYLCAAFLGLLAAESPIGFFLVIAFIMINNVVLKIFPILESPFFKPAVIAVSKWYITALFVLAILFGIGINCMGFVLNNGFAAGGSAGSLPILYLQGYAARIFGAASPGGWILWLGVCITPFVVAMMRFPSAADEETFLPYATGIVFAFCGLIAFTQVAPISVLWFWMHFPVMSDFMLSLGIFCSSVTLATAVTILGVDSLCRDHQRLAKLLYGSDDDEEEGRPAGEVSADSPISTAIRRTVVIFVPAVMVLAVIPDRMETKTRVMLDIVKDGLLEIVREAGDAKYLFTDGNLDVGIELASRKLGGDLICLPLVSRTANSARDVYLRTRGMQTDPEDLFSFQFDVGMGLRSWIRDKAARLETSAVMMGFDLWKRDGKAYPPLGGMLSRPAGWPSEDERKESIRRAYDLAARVLEVYAMDAAEATNQDVKNAFLAIQWRLARMCIYRGEQADLAGDANTAIAEADMAKRLNSRNETYQKLMEAMSKRNDMMMQTLTPREGLQLALVRADFKMGKMYAETILVADPENVDANFAMGMYYVKERQLTRAKEYLSRCLIRNPNEPTIYNNLAMIDMELGRYDSAEINAKKALAIIPDSAAVKDTLKQIEAKRAEKAKPAAENPKPSPRAF